MIAGAPPRAATVEFSATLGRIERLAALRVSTLTRAVLDPGDAVGWARLTTLGTAATVNAQDAAKRAVADYAMATLAAAEAPLDPVTVPVRTGYLGSGRDVQGMFAATEGVVAARTAGGSTFAEALTASASYLVGVAASEAHRVGRDGLLAAGSLDDRFERFRRVAEGGACDFCLMLATRGAVYLSADSAGQSRRYHTHCRCRIELVVGADAIGRSQSLAHDWRNAITDEQRLIDAGAMDGVASDAIDLMRTARTSGGWMPGNWESFDPAELIDRLPPHLSEAAAAREKLNALLTQGPSARRKERPIAHAVRNGNKTVISTQKLTAAQMQGLLSDFDEAIAAIPADLRSNPVTLAVPVGDSHWKGRTGGYVLAGSPRIHLKPAIATGAERWDESDFHMPAARRDRTRRDVIMHEMGHVVDGMRNTTGVLRTGSAKFSEDAFWARLMEQMPDRAYSQKNVHEGYAEMFMQYHVGGPGHPVADAYAARYRW